MRTYDKVILDKIVNNEIYYSDPFSIEDMYCFAIQAIWVGASGAGNVKIQATVSPDSNTWSDITGSQVTIAGGGDQLWNVGYVGYKWIRMVVESTNTNNIAIGARIYSRGMLP